MRRKKDGEHMKILPSIDDKDYTVLYSLQC